MGHMTGQLFCPTHPLAGIGVLTWLPDEGAANLRDFRSGEMTLGIVLGGHGFGPAGSSSNFARNCS